MSINVTVEKVNRLLASKAKEKGKPPPVPRPIIGAGSKRELPEAEVELIFYRWCQDIIGDVLKFQLETRPQQAVNMSNPNPVGGQNDKA